ncbi:GNAT family N-acetyltransferase [Phaeobacter sp. C3_T13_0]|uniref:GNAT family N-acetyltransferase n=1 Tax=Phaeobacter cretensis TaxID=3342641 RepID=UPI0039BC3A0D
MIREYASNDTDALIAIWEKANALAHPFLATDFVTFVRDALRNMYLPNAETWVIQDKSAPIGFIAMIGNEIGGLFLDPDHHGRGRGRELVDHVVGLKGPLCVDVFKDNKIGRPFYERYGFEFVDEYLHEQSGTLTLKMAMPGAKIA